MYSIKGKRISKKRGNVKIWQTEILSHLEKAFTYLPIESMTKKYKSVLLLFENELKVLECTKRKIIIGNKDIIEQTQLSDNTVRRILRKFLKDKK